MTKILKRVLAAIVLLLGTGQARAQNDARDAGYLYLSPVPGASYVSAQTRFVLIRFANVTPLAVTNLLTRFIIVTGANSGPHPGVTHVASDGRTVFFEMSEDFSENELVTVMLNPQVDVADHGAVKVYSYQFRVAAPMPGSLPAVPSSANGHVVDGEVPSGPGQGPAPAGGDPPGSSAVIKPNGVSVPGDFPAVVITVNSNPSPGYLFLENGRSVSPWYAMMLGNDGLPVWYRRGFIQDFKVQKNGMITWISNLSVSATASRPVSFDENFNHFQNYDAVNGYAYDGHEFKMLEDGGFLLLGSRTNTVNMSLYFTGWNTNANVRETVIQEFTAAGELIFQWRAWDHYDIRLSGTDFPHMNALELDEDGHILVSARHLNEVTKIHRQTGGILWRLSGENSSFTFVNDPLHGTRYQHHISALGNNHYLLFDNGNGRNPLVSRAVEYRLDLTNMTATLVWQFRDTPDKYSHWFGSAQRLPGGNTLINFVRPQYPKAIEVDTNGVKRFELSLVPGADGYRAFRFPWNGVESVPYLIVEPQPYQVALIFNKFGDTNVAYYRIYGGTSPEPTALLATSSNTLKHLVNLENGHRYYFRVSAVDGEGVESGYSNEENLTVNITKPGEETVRNGDFSQATISWTWTVTGGASAVRRFTNGVSHLDIVNGGSAVENIRLRQSGIPLFQGRTYIFQFDAWSQGPRYIEAKVGQIVSPNLDYSGIGFSYLTPSPARFRYLFTMQQASDFNANVIFNLGTSVFDVFLDNVSLYSLPPGDFNLDGKVDGQDLTTMMGGWLKQQPNLGSDLNRSGKVNFIDFAIFGENWSGMAP